MRKIRRWSSNTKAELSNIGDYGDVEYCNGSYEYNYNDCRGFDRKIPSLASSERRIKSRRRDGGKG